MSKDRHTIITSKLGYGGIWIATLDGYDGAKDSNHPIGHSTTEAEAIIMLLDQVYTNEANEKIKQEQTMFKSCYSKKIATHTIVTYKLGDGDMWIATLDGYDGADDANNPVGNASTEADAITMLLDQIYYREENKIGDKK